MAEVFRNKSFAMFHDERVDSFDQNLGREMPFLDCFANERLLNDKRVVSGQFTGAGATVHNQYPLK